MDAEQDDELQMVLALSLQEYNNTQSPQPDAIQQAGPSSQRPSSQSKIKTQANDKGINSPETGAGPSNPAGDSGTAAQRRKQRRGKKLPQFAPSEAEIDACFKELASNGRSHLTIADIIETGTKLGLELDHQKVGLMLEYLADNKVGNDVLRTGGISLQDFRDITQHFRVE